MAIMMQRACCPTSPLRSTCIFMIDLPSRARAPPCGRIRMMALAGARPRPLQRAPLDVRSSALALHARPSWSGRLALPPPGHSAVGVAVVEEGAIPSFAEGAEPGDGGVKGGLVACIFFICVALQPARSLQPTYRMALSYENAQVWAEFSRSSCRGETGCPFLRVLWPQR